MAVPPLVLNKTNLLGDNSGLPPTDLPDPDSIEFASPARAGLEGTDAEELATETNEPAAAEAAVLAEGELAKVEKPESEYASDPQAAADDADEPPAETEVDGDAFTPELLEQAKLYGYDADSAKRFGTVDNLQWAMIDADRRAAQWGQQQISSRQPGAPPQPQSPPAVQQLQQPPAPQQPAQQPSAQVAAPSALDKTKLAEQGFDEDAINVFTTIDQHYAGKFAEQAQIIDALRQVTLAHHQGLNQFTSQSQADEQAQFARDVDTYIQSLGPEWEAVYGKGSIYDLTPNSPEWNKRQELASTVYGLEVSDAQLNRTKLGTPKLAQRAHTSLHYEKQQELARKALAEKAGQRRSQAVARPGGQRAQPLSGKQRAEKRSQAFDNKHRLEPAVG